MSDNPDSIIEASNLVTDTLSEPGVTPETAAEALAKKIYEAIARNGKTSILEDVLEELIERGGLLVGDAL